jgi:flagellar biosynthesis protein
MNESKKIATALKFNPEQDAAPQVIAKGLGLIAENIIKRAEESDVPIYVDEKLSKQLKNLEIGEQIPYELYEVVAEVLVYISSVDQRKKGGPFG